MIKKSILLIFLICLNILFVGCSSNSKDKVTVISKQHNGISDFYIKDGYVYIIGGVTVQNNTNNTVSFSLEARSDADYESGLLKSPLLIGYDNNSNSSIFTINGNEVKTYTVSFVGEHGNYNIKNNRLMPYISIK